MALVLLRRRGRRGRRVRVGNCIVAMGVFCVCSSVRVVFEVRGCFGFERGLVQRCDVCRDGFESGC